MRSECNGSLIERVNARKARERGIPWEVGSDKLLDPVTTEVERSRWRSLSQDKSMGAIRRRPFDSRLHLPSYISGYVDGEGCFCVSLRPQPRIRVGWEIRPSFSVSQNDDRSQLIRLLPHLFNCGAVRPDRSDKTVKYEVRSLRNLVERVIPFFEEFPLLSSKRRDFEIFTKVCRMMQGGAHLTNDGVVMIAELVRDMNTSGTRRYTTKMIQASLSKVKG
jgi:hypothetical protein